MSKNKPAFNADDLIVKTEPKAPSAPKAAPPPAPAPQTPKATPAPQSESKESIGIKRYNMAFDSDIYDYLEARKWADRSTIKDLVNKIIREEMERHPVK